MAGLLDTIDRGLGAALTPLAMLVSGVHGGDPMAILRAREQDAMRQQLQNAQLGGLQQQQFATQAAGVQDPAIRAALLQRPEMGAMFGLQQHPGLPTGVQGPSQPGQMSVDLPPEVDTYKGLQLQHLQQLGQYQDLINQLLGGQPSGGGGSPTGQALGTILGASGGGAPSSTPPELPGAAPAQKGTPKRLKLKGVTASPSGASVNFAAPEAVKVKATDINPETGKPFQSSDTLNGNPVVIQEAGGAQANRAWLQRVQAARQGLKIFDTPIDAKTGAPLERDKGGQSPLDILPEATWYGSLGRAVLPTAISGLPIEYQAQQGDARAAYLTAGSANRALLVKSFGDAGNLSEQEQAQIERNLLPNKGDGKERGRLKLQAADQLLDAIEKKINDGYKGTPDPARKGDTPESAGYRELLTSSIGLMSGETPAPAAAPAGGPGSTPGTGRSEADMQSFIQKHGGRVLSRALGGSVPAGQSALVAGNAPELVTRPRVIKGPAQVQPMQLASDTWTQDLHARAAQAARKAVEDSARMHDAARQGVRQSSGGGGFQGGGMPAAAPTQAPVQVPTSAPLTAAGTGGALDTGGPPIAYGPDGLPIRQ